MKYRSFPDNIVNSWESQYLCSSLIPSVAFFVIHVRENSRDNEQWTIQRHSQVGTRIRKRSHTSNVDKKKLQFKASVQISKYFLLLVNHKLILIY